MRAVLSTVAATVLMIVAGIVATADAAVHYQAYSRGQGVESQAPETATGGPVGGFADRN